MDDTQALTGQQILDEGLEGWRKVLDRLVVRYATGDFNRGTALVTAIAGAADEANHHPDVDLRYPHVTVSLKSHDVNAITQRDVRLARRISGLAAEAGVSPTDAAPDVIELALDVPDRSRVKPFWEAILGYRAPDDVPDELRDAAERTPSMWFQDTDSDAPDRQRWHLDVSVPHDVAEQRLRAALDAGGTLVSDERAPAFWVLADADGNQACICTWQARD
jgi:4a-hydroxytetrahydrobiopterin dehydratase